MSDRPVLLPTTAIAGHARAEHRHEFLVARPPTEAFVLFEPVGEKNWAGDWQPIFATPADAGLHDGSVFTVERPRPGGGSPIASVWTIVRYEPPQAIEYHNVLIGVRATRIAVSCEPAGRDMTRVVVRYVFTGLSTEGDAAIAAMSPESFREMIDGWSRSIAEFLARGTPASR